MYSCTPIRQPSKECNYSCVIKMERFISHCFISIRMDVELSSRSALEKYCEESETLGFPGHLIMALVSAGISAGSGYGGFKAYESAISRPDWDIPKALLAAGAVAAGLVSLACVAGSVIFVAEAIKYGRKKPKDGDFFYVEEKALKKPSAYDRRAGIRIHPIETLDQLSSVGENELVFLNGIEPSVPANGSLMPSSSLADDLVPSVYDSSTLQLRGEGNCIFDKKPLTLMPTSVDESASVVLAMKNEPGQKLYVLGQIVTDWFDPRISVLDFGKQITKDTKYHGLAKEK
jgi:hypothetical protein